MLLQLPKMVYVVFLTSKSKNLASKSSILNITPTLIWGGDLQTIRIVISEIFFCYVTVKVISNIGICLLISAWAASKDKEWILNCFAVISTKMEQNSLLLEVTLYWEFMMKKWRLKIISSLVMDAWFQVIAWEFIRVSFCMRIRISFWQEDGMKE